MTRALVILSSAILLGRSAGAQDDLSFERMLGIVDEIEVDDFGGFISLRVDPIPVDGDTRYVDGVDNTINRDALEIGEHLTIHALWTSDGIPLARIVASDAEPPDDVPTLWIGFRGFEPTPDGGEVILSEGKVFDVAFDARAFTRDRTEMPVGEVRPGDFVAIDIVHSEFASVVAEIFVDPDEAELGGPEPGAPEPLWQFFGLVFDVDPELRTVVFENDPININQGTQFFDASGNTRSAESLNPGDPLVIRLDDTHTATVVEIQDFEQSYDHLFDQPGVGIYFVELISIQGDLLFSYDPFQRIIPTDVFIFNEQTSENLTGTIGLEELEGQFVRAALLHPTPDVLVPNDIVVEIGIDPVPLDDGPPDPGFDPNEPLVPTEIFGEWPEFGFVGGTLLQTRELVVAGPKVRVFPDTDIRDQDGNRVSLGELRFRDYVVVDGAPTTDPNLIVARSVRVNAEFPDEGFPPHFLIADVLRTEGSEIYTAKGVWPLSQDASVFDAESGGDLQFEDLRPGEFIHFVLLHTDIGDLISLIERNPVFDFPFDDAWEGDFEVFSVNHESREIRFAGPPFTLVSGTQVLNAFGSETPLATLAPGTEIIVEQAFSATGIPVARRIIEVGAEEFIEVAPDAFYAILAGIEGDVVITADFPRYLAVDGGVVDGTTGQQTEFEAIREGSLVRALIQHPVPGLFTPFGDVIIHMIVDPPEQEGPIRRPSEAGEFDGLVIDVVPEERLMLLEGPHVLVNAHTEILDLDREPVPLDVLLGELVSVNVFPGPEFLEATQIRLVDPLRPPAPGEGLIVAPLEDIHPLDDSGAPSTGVSFGERVLAVLGGPLLFVPGDAKVEGLDPAEFPPIVSADEIPLDLLVGNFVRVVVTAGQEFAVVLGISVLSGFDEPVFGGGGLDVVSTFPPPGATLIDPATVIEIGFSGPAPLDDPDFDVGFFPPVPFALDISRDGRILIIQPDAPLAADTAYEVFVASEVFGLFTFPITTGTDFPTGEIWGRVLIPPEIPFEAIALEESGVFLVDEEGAEDIFIRGSLFAPDGSYHLHNIPDGDYIVYAFLAVEFGVDQQLDFDAFYLNQFGDVATVSIAGDMIDGIDLTVLPPDAFLLESATPDYGDENVSTQPTITFSFSDEIAVEPNGLPAVVVHMFPDPLSGQLTPEDFSLVDEFTIAADVTLAANTNYTIVMPHAFSDQFLDLDQLEVIPFSTGPIANGLIDGSIGLPPLPDTHVVRTPALLLLIPEADFDPLDPNLDRRVVAATLTSDGFYSFEHVPPGSYVVAATVNVALPPEVRVAQVAATDESVAIAAEASFSSEPPPEFVEINFFGVLLDEATGEVAFVGPDALDNHFILQPEDRRKLGIRVDDVSPTREALRSAPLGGFDLTLVFSEDVAQSHDRIEMHAQMRPTPESGPIMDNASLVNGNQVVFRDIELNPDEHYKLAVTYVLGVSGNELVEPFVAAVIPEGGDAVDLGSVSGSVSVTGDEISKAGFFLFESSSDEGIQIIAGTVVEPDGSFLVEDVVAGDYGAYVKLGLVSGTDLLLAYDPDGDGVEDLVTVGSGQTAGVDFSISATTDGEPTGGNANAGFNIDLDPADLNQAVSSRGVAEGDAVELAIYANGLVEAAGVSVKVGFDSEQVAFKFGREAVGVGVNVLSVSEDAMTLFLPARLTQGVVEFGGAILSPASNTVFSGDGLVAVLCFETLAGYTSAKFVLEEVIVSALDGSQDVLQPQAAALVSAPVNLFNLPKGFISFDFDVADGDGGLPHLGNVSAGDDVIAEVYVNGAVEIVNYRIKFLVPENLSFVGFQVSNFLATNGGIAVGLSPQRTGNTVEIGASILGAKTGQGVTGDFLVGKMFLTASGDFAGDVDLIVTEHSTKTFGKDQESAQTSIFARISDGPLAPPASGDTDFNGDMVVDFLDVFAFADAFGSNDTQFDVDGDGEVGFSDFFRLAADFGRRVAKLMAVERPTRSGSLTLESRQANASLELSLVAADIGVRGYGAVVEYDPTAFRLESVTDAGSAMRARGGKPLLLTHEDVHGEVHIVGSRTAGAAGVDGTLARLRFEPVVKEAVGVFRVRQAAVRRSDGLLVDPEHLGQIEARLLPASFSLEANYPNPFNPTTSIPLGLPRQGEVNLDVFDVLGQKIRTLVDDGMAAGFHLISWDGRDDDGRQVGAGMYLYRLKVSSVPNGDGVGVGDGVAVFERVRKLTLIK